MAITNREDAINNNLDTTISNSNQDFLTPAVGHPIEASNLKNYFKSFISWIFPKATIAPFEDLSGKVLTVQYKEDSSPNTDYDKLAFTTMMPLGGITMFALSGKNVLNGTVYNAKYKSVPSSPNIDTNYDKFLDGFLFCDGSTIDLTQAGNFKYKPLKNLLIGYYGNTNDNNLRLPDMRGRVPLGFDSSKSSTDGDIGDEIGTHKGEQNYGRTGNRGGSDSIKLSLNEIPKHNHDYLFPGSITIEDGSGEIVANDWNESKLDRTTTDKGGDQSHENRMKYMVLNYIIKY